MSFRIECFNGFKVVDTVTHKQFFLRSHSRLLAALIFAGGEYVSREALISLIWKDELDGVARNRMRVALARFRTLLGSALLESESYIALSRDGVSTDVWDFEELLQSADDAVSHEGELEFLVSAIQMVRDSDLQQWGKLANGVIARAITACKRGTWIAGETGKPEVGLDFALVGLSLSPTDAGFCMSALEFAIQLGEGGVTLARIRGSESKELLAQPKAVEIVNRIRSGEEPQERIDGVQAHFWIEVLGIAIKNRPDLCRSMLASPEMLPLSGKQPREMLSLLEQVIVDPIEKNEDWERCVARATGLRAWLNDSAGVLELGYPLIEHSTNPIVLRATWNAVSVAHSLVRDWEKATDALAKTLEFAEQTGNEIDVLATRGNGASYMMHQRRFTEAEEEYESSLGRLRAIGTSRSLFDYAVGLGNSAFIPVFQGDLSSAKIRLEEAIRVRSESSMSIQLGLLQAALGYVDMKLGFQDQVLRLIRQGFIDAFQSQSDRNVQITFEFAAGALACTDEITLARGIIDWVNRWREQTHMPRSLAEQEFCDRMFFATNDLEGTELEDNLGPRQIGQLLMKKLRMQLL